MSIRLIEDYLQENSIPKIVKYSYSNLLEQYKKGRKYNSELVEDIIRFIEKNIYITKFKEQFKNKTLQLTSSQKAVIAGSYGFNIRETILVVGRKYGKSELATAFSLYGLMKGAGVNKYYIIATTKEQAKLMFNNAKDKIKHHPVLSNSQVILGATEISYKGNTIEVLAGDSGALDGLTPRLVICDEVAAWKRKRTYEDIVTSLGAGGRMIMITTNNILRGSVYDDLTSLAYQIFDEKQDIDQFLPLIYTLDNVEDWENKETWKQANPNVNVTFPMSYLESEFKKTFNLDAFKNKYLNISVGGTSRYINLEDLKNDKIFDENKLKKKDCAVGIDLSSCLGLTCVACLFPLENNYFVNISQYFAPASKLKDERIDRIPYSKFVADGKLKIAGDSKLDYKAIVEYMHHLARTYNLVVTGYDPWNFNSIYEDLREYNLEEIRTTAMNLSDPMKIVKGLFIEKKIIFQNNQLDLHNYRNVCVKEVGINNYLPAKSNATAIIDGFMALLYAFAVYNKQKHIYFSNHAFAVL